MTFDTSATDAARVGGAARATPPASVPLSRAEYRRLAAEKAAAEAAAASAPAQPVAPASVTEQVVLGAAAAALPLRRRTRAARTESTDAAAEPVSHAPEFLDETVVLPSATSTHLAAEQPGPRIADEFELAARVFAFTGETPIQVARAAVEAEAPPTTRARAAAALPAKPRFGKVMLTRVAAASFSVTVVGVVGLLAVGTTTPVSAVSAFGAGAQGDISLVAPQKASSSTEIQAYVAASDAKSGDLVRVEEYDVESMADVAADSGVTHFAGTWVNDASADIQWPFPVGVPISAAFGSGSYLSKFAMPHRGVDLTPGAGAEIHAVASGTVRIATEVGGDYGVTVVLDHIVDGQLVSTRYGHMQYGSLRVSPGETVEVGDVLGAVGSTGKATGPHLHFEVALNGTERIDPMAWMYEHTAE
ncbi:M23 family metallopeptidase [Microbacterium sp. 179-B 1A2 NHS]|uniref:M23 family metallopeptidase n=1 Tax=Microbacterium sp. 179-B 1A2 NHS TaxID=3142383 RepID=UPI0039A0C60F